MVAKLDIPIAIPRRFRPHLTEYGGAHVLYLPTEHAKIKELEREGIWNLDMDFNPKLTKR